MITCTIDSNDRRVDFHNVPIKYLNVAYYYDSVTLSPDDVLIGHKWYEYGDSYEVVTTFRYLFEGKWFTGSFVIDVNKIPQFSVNYIHTISNEEYTKYFYIQKDALKFMGSLGNTIYAWTECNFVVE